MRIIIAGAGEVGTHLAKLLSREEQDIILIDNDKDKLERIDSTHNLMTVKGSPTSFHTLKEAGVNKADLFIAVTPFESRNITACMMAANLGAVKTVARIDNNEYLDPANLAFFRNLGVDELIYPEMLAAKEVITALTRTWARNWFELCNGQLILIGAKLRSNAKIINQKLQDLTRTDNYYHIVAIKRKDETIIPRGNDTILENDIAYFITTPSHIDDIRQLIGKEDTHVKSVMIMGGSRIAMRVADLLPKDKSIKIIEVDREKCHILAEKVRNAVIIQSDARDVELLRSEGIDDIDAFIALTDSSETNILSCLTAKRLGVPKSVAEVEDISFISTAEELNIGSVINKKLLAASRIYQLLLDDDPDNVKCLTLASAEVAELVARQGSKITSAPVRELKLPTDLCIGGLVRDGKGVVVTGNTHIQPDDHVVVLCIDTAIRKIEKLFS